MKKVLIIVFAISTLAGLIACGPKSNPQETNTVLTAYRLIDEQRTDEAIALLEKSLAESPNNEEYKSVLASAYAHKAGIKIQRLAPLINQSERLKVFSGGFKFPIDQANPTAAQMASMFSQLSTFFEVYASIPVVSAEQAVYLRHAITVLSGLERPKQENSLYKAVLEIVLLKYHLAESFVGEPSTENLGAGAQQPQAQTQPQSQLPSESKDISNQSEIRASVHETLHRDGRPCTVQTAQTAEKLAQVGKIIVDICNDLALANPSTSEQMRQASRQMTDFVANLVTSTSTVTALDESANILLRDSAVHYGLGKLIRCGGS